MARGPVQITGRSKAAAVRKALSSLIGLKLLGSTNVFATRTFTFGFVNHPQPQDTAFALIIECPWRIESGDQILTGSDDFGTPAAGNLDRNWDPNSQTGSIQEQRLVEWLGAELHDGTIIACSTGPVVEAVEADNFGGFRIILSDACCLAVFPASSGEMEWMLRKSGHGYVSLMKGQLAGTLHGM
jgi:hypothetical protein